MIYEVEVNVGNTQYWRYNGKLHREGDQPAVIHPDGYVEYCKDDELHREGDQPAVIHPDGYKAYYKNGKRHREGDQPAVIWVDGSVQYWKDGVHYTPKPADPCDGKEVEIEGKKYKLVAI